MLQWMNLGNTWEARTPTLRIRVHRHIDYPGKWLFSTAPDIFKQCPLDATEIEAAKAEAMRMIRDRLEEMLNAVR